MLGLIGGVALVVGVVLGMKISSSSSGSAANSRCPVRKDCIEVTHAVAFKIKIGQELLPDEIVIGLFGRDAPKSVENFYGLSLKLGPDGKTLPNGYEGSKFYEIGEFYIKAGDFRRNDGKILNSALWAKLRRKIKLIKMNSPFIVFEIYFKPKPS